MFIFRNRSRKSGRFGRSGEEVKMPRKAKTEETLPAHFYFMKLREWQAFLDHLRAEPPSEWRDKRIDETFEKIMTYELFVRPIPTPGRTLEEERREDEAFARRVQAQRKAEATRRKDGVPQPWNGFAVYEGEERVL
jgi:hypothetical protein